MIVAVDVGGTKTLVATFDSDGNMAKTVIKIATSKDSSQFVLDLKNTINSLDQELSANAIVIGIPGIVNQDGLIQRCANLPWHNFDLKSILAKDYHCPIHIKNDAKLAGLAETNALTVVPPLSLYITIGTGIGSGIILHGKLDPALSLSEAGHMAFTTQPGHSVIWESFASGRAITKRLGHPAHDITNSEDWQAIAESIATGLMVLIPALQPDIVIIGGSIGLYTEYYLLALNKQLKQNIPSFINIPPIVPAIHGYQAVLYGCNYYAKHQQSA
ncbi:MAG TPA: ROK family protein [Patescibacteria group bacterium]|nr:ROK family protein [Patescibacteria group bacterium]